MVMDGEPQPCSTCHGLKARIQTEQGLGSLSPLRSGKGSACSQITPATRIQWERLLSTLRPPETRMPEPDPAKSEM